MSRNVGLDACWCGATKMEIQCATIGLRLCYMLVCVVLNCSKMYCDNVLGCKVMKLLRNIQQWTILWLFSNIRAVDPCQNILCILSSDLFSFLLFIVAQLPLALENSVFLHLFIRTILCILHGCGLVLFRIVSCNEIDLWCASCQTITYNGRFVSNIFLWIFLSIPLSFYISSSYNFMWYRKKYLKEI